MSKIIRTGRVSGDDVVTLGRHEEGLYLDSALSRGKAPTIDLEAIISTHRQALTSGLEKEWEGRLREEHATTRSAGERQFAEAEERHQEEMTRVHQERYDEGRSDGVAEKEDEAHEAVKRMTVLHEALRHDRDQVLFEAETLVVDLALATARRVTQTQSEMDPKIVARTIRSALQHLSERSNLVIKVHQADLQIARRFANAWVERVDQDAVLKVRASDHVTRGGCMVEGGEENVDARLTSQLDVMQQALRDQVEEAYAEHLDSPGSLGETVGGGPDAQPDAQPDPQDAQSGGVES